MKARRSQDEERPAIGRAVWVFDGRAGPERVKVRGKIISVGTEGFVLGGPESLLIELAPGRVSTQLAARRGIDWDYVAG